MVKDGRLTDEILHLDATEEQERLIAQANEPLDENRSMTGDSILCRTLAGQYVYVEPTEVDLIDVSPEQIWSVATAMIPFLEHDDANRALMGSNMQRQAVPLLKTDAPLVGTGMERRAALRHRRRAAGRATPARSTSSTPPASSSTPKTAPATSTSCRSSCAPTRAR